MWGCYTGAGDLFMRSKQEIAGELAALKELKPVGPFRFRTKALLALAMEELEHGVDQSAGDWDDLSDAQRDVVWQVFSWKEGASDEKPSERWGGLAE